VNAHPVADLFPMMADDELDELATDIQERGLLHPVVLDHEGRVLDGRNRLVACERVGIEPTFETYDGEDPGGYALAVNMARRNMRPSQRYIVIEQARRLTKTPKSGFERSGSLDANRLSEAAVVLDFAPDLARVVVGGGMSLDTAATEARERKRRAAELESKKERLRQSAPDLAEHVGDGRLDLDEALAALNSRQAKAREEAEAKASEDARKAQAASMERARDIESARSAAASIVADLQTRVVSIIIGVRHGEPRLIDKAMVRQLRDAIDQLEELL
jgi:ParB-like chromosome segregation protein Spo0J